MDMIVSEKLGKIYNLFLEYENVTDLMLQCNIYEVDQKIEAREKIRLKIDKIKKEIHEYSENHVDKDDLNKALKVSIDKSEINPKYHDIFERQRLINSIIDRILSKEPQIIERINIEKDFLLEKIKKNNKGPESKASKYYSVSQAIDGNNYIPKKNKIV